jgi:hypothetical protein
MQAIFVGAAAAIAMAALCDAAPLGNGETTVASGSVRPVDQATDLPAPPPGLPLPSPVDLSQLEAPDVQQVWARMLQLAASPPPNVPNEICRFNTVRVPC